MKVRMPPTIAREHKYGVSSVIRKCALPSVLMSLFVSITCISNIAENHPIPENTSGELIYITFMCRRCETQLVSAVIQGVIF